ncbi:MAG: response regulator [Burkholderiaceae bacterium]|nr:response regulator [Burkholderiaceae bacterium]
MPLILVIEDDPTQRLLSSSVLRNAGYEVTEATNGKEGLKLAGELKPDLIVCDVMMPGLNGYQMVAALKEAPDTSTIPVIFLSAMKEHAHIRIGMTTGADDYLPKPFSATELKQSVASLLAKRQLQEDKFSQDSQEKISAALKDQQRSLSGKYEQQLMKELNKRFQGEIDSGPGLRYAWAPVVTVDLFGSLLALLPQDERLAGSIKRLYVAASDALYLFGAHHLLPFGHHLVAVFASDVATSDERLKFLAVRAAFGVKKAVRSTLEGMALPRLHGAGGPLLVHTCLDAGPVTLLRLDDPLHGDAAATLVTGQAVSCAIAMSAHARAARWPLSCSAGFATGLDGQIVTGRPVALAPGLNHPELSVMELLSMAGA